MTYASSITEYVVNRGPAAVAAVGILTFAILALLLQLVRWLVISNNARRVEVLFAERSLSEGHVNPAKSHFANERINLTKLANPLTNMIIGKRFDDCEVFGPATVFVGSSTLYGMRLENINLIAIREDRPSWQSNFIVLVNCEFRGGTLSHVNLLGHPKMLADLVLGLGAPLLSYSGVDELDAVDPPRQPQGVVNR